MDRRRPSRFQSSSKKVEGKCYPSGQGNRFRHHPIYDDYYAYTYKPYGYYNGYAYEKHYTTRPSLFSGPGRPSDNKYHHPKVQFRQLNGAFPGYYEMTPYDYYGEAYYNGYSSSRPQQSSKKGVGRRNSKEEKDKEGEKKDKETDKDKLYNDEFPPLNGNFDQQDTKGSKQVNGKGVWGCQFSENDRLYVVAIIFEEEPRKTPGNTNDPSGSYCQAISRTQVRRVCDLNPHTETSVSHKNSREGLQLNGSRRDQSSFGAIKPPTSSSSSLPSYSKEHKRGYTWRPVLMEEEEPGKTPERTTSPREATGKLSHIPTLAEPETQTHDEENKPEYQLETEDNYDFLAGFFETQRRLLRETDWNEADEEEYKNRR